ncbi:hypothetical protein B0H14DRAFT_3140548 [Mycena olivaceomarginata]|nr:hypothetical protein B0H14DRAFT_3140548 [Mycena olivaceomarginata]
MLIPQFCGNNKRDTTLGMLFPLIPLSGSLQLSMETVFAIGDPEAATDEQLSAISAEKHRQNRRAAQRNRRTNQDTAERHLIRDQNSGARRVARSVLADADRERIRIADTTAHTAARSTGVQASTNRWWDQVSRLNSSQVPKPLGLRWNRVCKHCGIRFIIGDSRDNRIGRSKRTIRDAPSLDHHDPSSADAGCAEEPKAAGHRSNIPHQSRRRRSTPRSVSQRRGRRQLPLVTRNLVTDVVAHEQGLLDDQGLLSRGEIKLGGSQDFDQCLPGYRACQQMYRHEWKAVYTTSERKLTEHLVQDETRFARRPRTVCSCHKRHTEWVDYLSVGGEQGIQNEFLRWIALRGLTTIIKYISHITLDPKAPLFFPLPSSFSAPGLSSTKARQRASASTTSFICEWRSDDDIQKIEFLDTVVKEGCTQPRRRPNTFRETRELLKGTPGEANYCQIVIGTDCLSVGVGMPARLECVMIGGKVEDTDAFLRRLRRVGRTQGGNQRARGIIYLSAISRKLAQKTLDDHAASILKAGETPPDLSMPILITAPCKVIAQNEIYNNPPSDPQCTCPPCISNPPAENITPPVRAARASKVNTNIPKAKRLSKIQKAHGFRRLLELRLEIWQHSPPLQRGGVYTTPLSRGDMWYSQLQLVANIFRAKRERLTHLSQAFRHPNFGSDGTTGREFQAPRIYHIHDRYVEAIQVTSFVVHAGFGTDWRPLKGLKSVCGAGLRYIHTYASGCSSGF